MEITAEKLQEKIDSGEKIIVDLFAEWCGPCRVMKPIFEKVSNENTSDVNLYTLNVEENRDFAVKHGVRSIPTTLVFSDGAIKQTKVGALKEQDIRSLIDDLILS